MVENEPAERVCFVANSDQGTFKLGREFLALEAIDHGSFEVEPVGDEVAVAAAIEARAAEPPDVIVDQQFCQ